MNRRHFLATLSAATFITETRSAAEGIPAQPKVKSLAYEWLDIIQEATANEVDRAGPRPPVLSRQMAIPLTAMFDAWAAYDPKAVGTRLGGKLRRPTAEHTDDNKKKAISYAAFHSLLDEYPADKAYLTAEMKRLGYDPADLTTDLTTPQGIGLAAAAAVLAYRRFDGANQTGDETGGNGTPYSDYTFYQPINPPDKIINPDRWQLIEFKLPGGKKVTPNFLAPRWYRVKPFALKSASQFRPAPPPLVGSAQLLKEAQECIDFNASLSDEQKGIVEFMRDGPRSTGQSGHWLRFAQAVSRRDHFNLDQDIKLFFATANVSMDAFIAAWESKRYYDSSRPWTLIHHLFKGQEIKGWGGPGKGFVTMKGEDWHPYSPESFVTPPFPGYVSGHSCVSGGCAKLLELFTGSDVFGEVEIRPCCELTEPTPGQKVTLKLPTFTATADMAGISRVMGGYHIQADNIAGLKLGRDVASYAWPVLQSYFDGSAKVVDGS